MWKWIERVSALLGIPASLLAIIPIVIALVGAIQINDTTREWIYSNLTSVFQILNFPFTISLPFYIVLLLIPFGLFASVKYVIIPILFRQKEVTTVYKNHQVTYYVKRRSKLPTITRVVCGYCGGLITEVGIGIPNIMGTVYCENHHDLGSNEGYASIQAYTNFIIRSFQNEYRNKRTELKSPKFDQTGWGKSGNLWWLCRDVAVLISLLMDADSTKLQIDHYLLKCHHHATKVMMDEEIIVKLQNLKDHARNYSQSDWTPQRRREYGQTLNSIYNDMGRISERNQTDFDAGPSLL